MRRIALTLLLYILLTNAPHKGQERPLQPSAMRVAAAPLPLPSQTIQRGYGPLRLTGLWHLTSDLRAFGGLSALLADGGGRFVAISDTGEWARFSLDAAPGAMAALPRLPTQESEQRKLQDSESLARDSRTHRLWVGFEGARRICRYAAGFRQVERCGTSTALQAWPYAGGLESLVRLSDGRFLAIGERANAPTGGYDVLLWAGDPVEAATPPPVHLSYLGPTGYRPTDALWLGGDRLLVLNRRYTVFDGFTARLTLVRLPPLRAGAVLRGRVVAAFERPGPVDNLEGLALSREGNAPALWIVSDNNHLSLQRSLLFRFALPPDWVSDAPPP